MNLSDIVHSDAIVTDLGASDRDAAIKRLLDAAIEAGAADAEIRDELLASILDRESKGSTGFGRGVAIPHVKHERIREVKAAVGVSDQGIDFNALDKQPVYSIFLLLSPQDEPETHLRAMEVIFTNLSKETFRRLLRQAGSRDDVLTLLDDVDNQRLPS